MCCVSFCRIRHISAQTSLDPLPPDLSLSRLLLPRGHFRDFPLFPSTPPLSLPQDCFLELFQTKTESGGRERPGERGRHFTHSFVSSSVCPSPLSLSLSLSHTHFFLSSGYFPPFSKRQRKQKKASQPPRKKTACRAESQRESWFMGWMDGWIQFGGPPFPTKNTRFADPSLPSFQFPNTHRPLASTAQKEIPDPAIGCGGTIHPSSSSITQLSKLPHHNRDHPKHHFRLSYIESIFSFFLVAVNNSWFPAPLRAVPPSLGCTFTIGGAMEERNT